MSEQAVPSNSRDWDAKFSGEGYFFGREPSDLGRSVYGFWKELNGERRCRVLDFGCGEGRDSVYLASKGFQVTGVDASSAGLAKARQLAASAGAEVEWVQVEDARDYPLAGGFEIILCNNLLQFLGADCLPWLRRIQDATPDGGLNGICAFTRESEALAGRADLYRFEQREVRFHYRDWRLLQYREEILWRPVSQMYLSFAAVIAQKIGD